MCGEKHMVFIAKMKGHSRRPRVHLNGREPLGWRLAGLWQAGHAHRVLSRGTGKTYGQRYCQEVLLRGTVRRYGEEVRLEVWLRGTVKRYG